MRKAWLLGVTSLVVLTVAAMTATAASAGKIGYPILTITEPDGGATVSVGSQIGVSLGTSLGECAQGESLAEGHGTLSSNGEQTDRVTGVATEGACGARGGALNLQDFVTGGVEEVELTSKGRIALTMAPGGLRIHLYKNGGFEGTVICVYEFASLSGSFTPTGNAVFTGSGTGTLVVGESAAGCGSTAGTAFSGSLQNQVEAVLEFNAGFAPGKRVVQLNREGGSEPVPVGAEVGLALFTTFDVCGSAGWGTVAVNTAKTVKLNNGIAQGDDCEPEAGGWDSGGIREVALNTAGQATVKLSEFRIHSEPSPSLKCTYEFKTMNGTFPFLVGEVPVTGDATGKLYKSESSAHGCAKTVHTEFEVRVTAEEGGEVELL